MSEPVLGDEETADIDAALATWRQGDFALGEQWFVHVADPAAPLTEAAERAAADEGPQALTSEVAGLIVLTQTCDIVRRCSERPYLEVAPVVELNEDELRSVQRGRRPAYATFPNLAAHGLAADLDRVMTVEKAIVATWERSPGCRGDDEIRDFARALARKRARFAFPDDFNTLAKKLVGRLAEKHGKQTLEGSALRALREIRVNASPSWDAAEVDILIWFVRANAEEGFAGVAWADHLEAWLKLMPSAERFRSVEGQITSLAELTAADYIASDVLDLDHLSSS